MEGLMHEVQETPKKIEYIDLANEVSEAYSEKNVIVTQLIYGYDKDFDWGARGEGFTSLSKHEAQKFNEVAGEFMIRGKDLAVLYFGREMIHFMEQRGTDPGLIQELKDDMAEIKEKIVDLLILRLPRDYGSYGKKKMEGITDLQNEDNKIEGLDVDDPLFTKKYAQKVMNPYIRGRIDSGDQKFVSSEEGRELLSAGLEKLDRVLEYSPLDSTLQTLIKLAGDNTGLEGSNFESLLDHVHSSNAIFGTIQNAEEKDLCRFIVTIRNSKRYGMARMWNYIPTRMKEKFVRDTGAITDMVKTYGGKDQSIGEADIALVAESIDKPHRFENKIMLAEAVMEYEKDEKLKIRLKEALKARGLDIDRDFYDAMKHYEAFKAR